MHVRKVLGATIPTNQTVPTTQMIYLQCLKGQTLIATNLHLAGLIPWAAAEKKVFAKISLLTRATEDA